ncbi:PMID: 11932238 [uncultured Candidatus Thioglobus sp.]|nr:PMID: 11932238 [uncultured Candidatus Thioglobus sp.]
MKNNEYTAIIKKDGSDYIGWIEEIPGVNCQEKSMEKLKETLKITLSEALEFNRQDAMELAGNTYQKEKIAVSV